MAINRRDFLKVAGVGALFGLAAPKAYELLSPGAVDAAQDLRNPKGLAGQHWGLAVDLTKFASEEDVRPLVEACHTVHNVPSIPTKQDIKWLWATTYAHAFPDLPNTNLAERYEATPVLVMCNHCENPPCVRACPTQATYKRASDGIVMMDMHRCIGCRFCMAACPYGSRSFNFSDPRKWFTGPGNPPTPPNPDYPTRMKGVVEKCNFCAERLAVGQIPACVEAAKDDALIFGDLNDPLSPLGKALRGELQPPPQGLPGHPPSVYTSVRSPCWKKP